MPGCFSTVACISAMAASVSVICLWEPDQDVGRICTIKLGIETMARGDGRLPVGSLIGQPIARLEMGVD